MKERFKDFKATCLIDDIESQKTRYKESYYHHYDDIYKIRLKQRTSNVR